MGADHYQFRVTGHLGPTLLTAFPTLAPHQHGPDTVLTGPLPDSAALYGILAEFEGTGISSPLARWGNDHAHEWLDDTGR